MTMNWKPGDRAIVNYPSGFVHGMVVTVTSDLMLISCPINGTYMGHEIDVPQPGHPGQSLAFEPHELRPIDDGNELGSWSDCVFKPKELICN